jgi:hypothetical protein
LSSDSDKLKDYLAHLKQIGTRVNPEFYERLIVILRRDNLTFQDFLGRNIIEHIKVHEDGNQNYKLELFADPNMVATPAFHRNIEVWRKYVKTLDKKHLKEFDSQVMMLTNLSNRRLAELG